MSPGARALVRFLAEQIAAAELEREDARAAEIDRTRNAEQNAAKSPEEIAQQ